MFTSIIFYNQQCIIAIGFIYIYLLIRYHEYLHCLSTYILTHAFFNAKIV